MAQQRKKNDDSDGGGGEDGDDDTDDDRDFCFDYKREVSTDSTKQDQLHSKSADNVRSHRDLPHVHSRRLRKLSACCLLTIAPSERKHNYDVSF